MRAYVYVWQGNRKHVTQRSVSVWLCVLAWLCSHRLARSFSIKDFSALQDKKDKIARSVWW